MNCFSVYVWVICLYKSMDIRAEAAISQAVQMAIADAESLWAPKKFDGVFPTKGFGIKRLEASDQITVDKAYLLKKGPHKNS